VGGIVVLATAHALCTVRNRVRVLRVTRPQQFVSPVSSRIGGWSFWLTVITHMYCTTMATWTTRSPVPYPLPPVPRPLSLSSRRATRLAAPAIPLRLRQEFKRARPCSWPCSVGPCRYAMHTLLPAAAVAWCSRCCSARAAGRNGQRLSPLAHKARVCSARGSGSAGLGLRGSGQSHSRCQYRRPT
jgi:hypothetical protein